MPTPTSKVFLSVLSCILLNASFLLVAGSQAAEPATSTQLDCNQLGRELALRAVEQLELGIDASQRASLAGLAEEICLDFQVLRPVSEADQSSSGIDAGVAGEQETDEGFFNLEKIAPQDRVRRPGLKRF